MTSGITLLATAIVSVVVPWYTGTITEGFRRAQMHDGDDPFACASADQHVAAAEYVGAQTESDGDEDGETDRKPSDNIPFEASLSSRFWAVIERTARPTFAPRVHHVCAPFGSSLEGTQPPWRSAVDIRRALAIPFPSLDALASQVRPHAPPDRT